MPRPLQLILLFCSIQSILFGNNWNTVYLASFPRSGNHWVRYLVEEATHIATSSSYRDRDFPHLKDMFPWGGYCTDHGYNGNCQYPTKNDPVLLKTHYPFHPKKIESHSRPAICLIRHPVDAFGSFYIYKGGKEGTQIDKDKLLELIHRWKTFYEFWENRSDILFIRYEDLQLNTATCLSHILQTAGYKFDNADIERAVTKYPSQGQPLKHLGYYDAQTIELIKKELGTYLTMYNYAL